MFSTRSEFRGLLIKIVHCFDLHFAFRFADALQALAFDDVSHRVKKRYDDGEDLIDNANPTLCGLLLRHAHYGDH